MSDLPLKAPFSTDNETAQGMATLYHNDRIIAGRVVALEAVVDVLDTLEIDGGAAATVFVTQQTGIDGGGA